MRVLSGPCWGCHASSTILPVAQSQLRYFTWMVDSAVMGAPEPLMSGCTTSSVGIVAPLGMVSSGLSPVMVTVGSPAAGATASPVASSKLAEMMSTTKRMLSPFSMPAPGLPSA